MKFAIRVFLSKEDLLILSDLSGNKKSITEYIEGILKEHIEIKKSNKANAPEPSQKDAQAR